MGEIIEELNMELGNNIDKDIMRMRGIVKCEKSEALRRGNMFKDLVNIYKDKGAERRGEEE